MFAHKNWSAWLVVFGVAVVVGVMALLAPQAVVAQCEDPQPSCCACHAEAHPVFDQGEWHTIHARKECCRACHGGNDRTADKDAAHVGMTLHPLQNTYLACHQCHPDDYQQRAEVFAVALHVTPLSQAPTARPSVLAVTPPPLVLTPLPQSPAAATPVWDWPVVLIGVVLIVGLVALVWNRLHSI